MSGNADQRLDALKPTRLEDNLHLRTLALKGEGPLNLKIFCKNLCLETRYLAPCTHQRSNCNHLKPAAKQEPSIVTGHMQAETLGWPGRNLLLLQRGAWL